MTYMEKYFNMKILALVTLLLITATTQLAAQRGFEGSAVIGLTTSQIDGDDLLGFNKLGLSSGLKVAFNLEEKLMANLEVLYSQRGSSEKLFERSDDLALTALNYFELPIYLSYGDWYVKEDDYYRMRAHLGISYAVLLSSKGVNERYEIEELGTNDFSFLIGATYSFSPHWALTARYTRSLNKLLVDDSFSPGYLLGYFWTIRCEYSF